MGARGHALLEDPKNFRKMELLSQKRQARRLLEFRQARRMRVLKERSIGDPIIDRLATVERKVRDGRSETTTVYCHNTITNNLPSLRSLLASDVY